MMSDAMYSVRIKRSAAKELANLPQQNRLRVSSAINSLGEQPFAGSVLKGGLRGLRRLRVGDYRIVYALLDNELVLLIVRIAHRSDVYKRE